MKQDVHFWLTMLIRGFIALLAGSLVMVIPDMARTLLLLPFAITISVLGLAAYGIIDSVLVLVSSFMTTSRPARLALLSQGSIGIVIGTLLLFVVFDQVRLEWFLSLAAIQAFIAGIAEILVARHAATHATSIWNYTASVVALCSSVAYLFLRLHFASSLTAEEISWFVYYYLVAFGIAQCLTAARMIYSDRQFIDVRRPKA